MIENLIDAIELSWIKFIPRPKKDGLHDSGYRFIKLVGVGVDGEEHDLGEWHDHLIVEPSCNIDVEPDGTIRIMPWGGTKFYTAKNRTFWSSTAWVTPNGKVS